MRGTQQRVGLIPTLAMAVAIFGPLRLDSQEVSSQAFYGQAGKALDAGKAALALKRYDEAVRQYRQVLSRDSHNETAMLNLALAYYKQGDFSKARNELDDLHKLRPANRQAFHLLADCDLRLGNYRDAIALVEPAYEAQADDPAIEYILGAALIQDGQTQRGAAVIDRMMRNGNSAVGSVLMGASQYAAGDYKASAATLRKALDLNPELPGAWTIYGRALLSGGENEEAKTAFRRALQADPNDFDACLHLGAVLRHDGDTEGAGPHLRHALVLRPDSAAVQFQVWALDAATGHLEEAKSGFEKLVKQWPDFVRSAEGRGVGEGGG